MHNVGFIDILLYVKKYLRFILLCSLIGLLLAMLIASKMQSYTASVSIEYTYDGAESGLDPLGEKLDVYEITSPTVIENALKEMNTDLTVEEVRNNISISPVVTSSTLEIQQALKEKGEDYEVFPVEYNISFNYPGKYGKDFGNQMLYNILRSYDTYFSQQYLDMKLIPDITQIVDFNHMDYMEICELLDVQLSEINTILEGLEKEDITYRSPKTGLNFTALKSYFYNLRVQEYDKLYANVRSGLLAKDRETLLKRYQSKVENLQLNMLNSTDESQLAHEMVSKFYDQYKKSNLYYRSRSTQSELGNDNKNMVFDQDLTLMINTYDDILLRYVNSGVNASNFKYDANFYNKLIDEFAADRVEPEEKQELTAVADMLLDNISKQMTDYSEQANKTLKDFYAYKVAQYLKNIMSVAVVPTFSLLLFALLGCCIGFFFSCALVILMETYKQQMEAKRIRELLNQGGEIDAITPEMLENMTALERAFYEQAKTGFEEFYLVYQPIVDKKQHWMISEALIRWDSKRMGKVMPNEFIPIAQKYNLLDVLGEWVLVKACKQSNLWAQENIISPNISINYAIQQIESQSFIDSICKILHETKVNGRHIYLEISGGGEMQDPESIAQKFIALKTFGVHLAIDRFGESVSSMRALYDLPLDMVKIDKKYITSLEQEHVDPFLHQVFGLCEELGLFICMEGVEAKWQIETLVSLGVDFMQGFYFSNPLPVDQYVTKYKDVNPPYAEVLDKGEKP